MYPPRDIITLTKRTPGVDTTAAKREIRKAGAPGIEITAEMVEAGVCALEAAEGAFAPDDLVVRVYSAMRLLEGS